MNLSFRLIAGFGQSKRTIRKITPNCKASQTYFIAAFQPNLSSTTPAFRESVQNFKNNSEPGLFTRQLLIALILMFRKINIMNQNQKKHIWLSSNFVNNSESLTMKSGYDKNNSSKTDHRFFGEIFEKFV